VDAECIPTLQRHLPNSGNQALANLTGILAGAMKGGKKRMMQMPLMVNAPGLRIWQDRLGNNREDFAGVHCLSFCDHDALDHPGFW